MDRQSPIRLGKLTQLSAEYDDPIRRRIGIVSISGDVLRKAVGNNDMVWLSDRILDVAPHDATLMLVPGGTGAFLPTDKDAWNIVLYSKEFETVPQSQPIPIIGEVN